MIDTDRHAAFEQLLAQPDPPDLRTPDGVRRGHHPFAFVRGLTSKDVRRKQIWLPLLVRWAQHRCAMVDPDPYIAPARLARERLRRVK